MRGVRRGVPGRAGHLCGRAAVKPAFLLCASKRLPTRAGDGRRRPRSLAGGRWRKSHTLLEHRKIVRHGARASDDFRSLTSRFPGHALDNPRESGASARDRVWHYLKKTRRRWGNKESGQTSCQSRVRTSGPARPQVGAWVSDGSALRARMAQGWCEGFGTAALLSEPTSAAPSEAAAGTAANLIGGLRCQRQGHTPKA